MTKRMLIDAVHPDESRVVITDNNRIQELDFITSAKKQIKGNIYLAKITRVEPSLQAAFVEYGGGKQGFLPFAEIHPDYYQIPISDRQRLMEEAMAEPDDDDDDDARSMSYSEQDTLPTPSDESYATPVESAEFTLDDFTPESAQALPSFIGEAIPENTIPDDALPEDILPEDAPLHTGGGNGEAPALTDVEASYRAAEIAQAVTYSETEFPPPAQTMEAGADARPASAGEEATDVAPARAETVENLSDDEERRPRRNYTRRYKIQEVIKRNQILLVQVIKEERGNKGVSLSTFISLAGRFCVLMPNSPKGGGISRKISNNDDRRRLKAISSELRVSGGMSAIIRTAGIDRTRVEIRRDFDYLVKLWNGIREMTLASTAPALVYEEGGLVKRALRDMYNSSIEEVIIDGEEAYNDAKEFMKLIMPSHAPRVKLHKGSLPLYYAEDVEEQLHAMNEPSVRLRSGGYIVIGPTEALIAIDVNSGRSTTERNIEETALKTNLEAAAEIARQIRLRDLAGLLVIDFIDMMDYRNRRAVERALKDALRQDRAKIQLGRISAFGLLEMSRQRMRPSISEVNTMQCPHCQGRGVVRSNESLAIQIMRALEKEAAGAQYSELKLVTSAAVAQYVFNSKREVVKKLEEEYQLSISVAIDAAIAAGTFRIEKVKPRRGGQEPSRRPRGRSEREDRYATAPDAPASDETFDATPEEDPDMPASNIEEVGARDQEDSPRRGRGKRRGGRGRDRDRSRPRFEQSDTPRDAAPETAAPREGELSSNRVDSPEGQENGEPHSNRSRPRRGRRGGRNRDRNNRNWKEREVNGEATPSAPGEPAAANNHNRERMPRPAAPPPPSFEHSPSSASMHTGGGVAVADAGDKPKRSGWWRKIVK